MSLGVWLFIFALVVVIMIHEAGHLLVAKAFRFKATQYFLGFGPTFWSFRRGETEYGVKAIPAGGFVKIVGMNPYEQVAPEDQPRSYPNKPKYQRALLLVAGSAMHWVIAFVLLLIASMVLGQETGRATTQVGRVSEDSPAEAAGFHAGDKIVAADGRSLDTWEEVSSFIRAHDNQTVDFTVERGSSQREISVLVGQAIFNKNGRSVVHGAAGEDLRAPKEGEKTGGFLGIEPRAEYQKQGFADATGTAASRTWEATKVSVVGIKEVFATVFDGRLWDALTGSGERGQGEGPIGLVGAGRVAGGIVERGAYPVFVDMIVIFTVFIGMMNLLPLPPLDGGHLAVVAYEAISGRRVDIRKLIPVAAAVISFFVLLFLAVLYLDIARPIQTNF